MTPPTSGTDALSRELGGLDTGPIASEVLPGVSYVLESAIGRGGFATAFLASRRGPDGQFPVVLKIMRPSAAVQGREMIARLFKKEVVALGRLNERVPPTPFVVRLLDSGSLRQVSEGQSWEVPWLAIEYVHGGVEGETLSKRVRYSVRHTAFAFEPERAAHLIRQLAGGLSEIHAVEVVHRDLKPSNVLCCGFGPSEVVKISDFGIARPTGVTSTFGKLSLGTPGYVAPEQMHLREEIGPWTDVFSFAGVVFYMLAGEKYFDVTSPIDGVFAASSAVRRSLLDARALSPSLREQPDACRALDDALRRATAADPRDRFESAAAFAAALLPWLRQAPMSLGSQRHASSVVSGHGVRIEEREPAGWKWVARRLPGGDTVVVDVAWSSDGHCLAPTQRGLSYWDGSNWMELHPPPLSPIHMVRALDAGRWLLSGSGGQLHVFDGNEALPTLTCPDPALTLTAFAGDLQDLAAMVAVAPNGSQLLLSYCGGHWLKPLPVEFAASVPGFVRLDAERWLVTGRNRSGGAFAGIYRPLEWRLEVVAQPDVPALVAAANQPQAAIGIAAGGSAVVEVGRGGVRELQVSSKTSWSACGVDVLGGRWVAGAGRVWFAPSSGGGWREVWCDPGWQSPFVSLYADVGRVLAVTADGGVLEGHAAS